MVGGTDVTVAVALGEWSEAFVTCLPFFVGNQRRLMAEPGSSITRFFRALNARYRRKRTIKARPDLTLSVLSDADYYSLIPYSGH